MCLIPGLPKFAFLAVAAGLFWGGRKVASSALVTVAPTEAGPADKKKAEQTQGSDLAALLRLEDLTLEIGFQLIPLVDEKQGGQLLSRGSLAAPPSLCRNGISCPPGPYFGQSAAEAPRISFLSARPGKLAAGRPKGRRCWPCPAIRAGVRWPARKRKSPPSGSPAIWIAPALEDQAIAAGYSVVDAVTVITTHLGELIRQHAYELLGRETKRLMDSLNESHPKLMEELVPKMLTLGEVGRVLEQLLRERVSIRDLGSILEALLETAPMNKNPIALVEAARQVAGTATDPAAAGRRRNAAGDAARPGHGRRDSQHPRTRHRTANALFKRAAGRAAGAPSRRFCEATYRLRIACGPSRASLSESGALSRQALAGTNPATACRRIGRRDSTEVRLRP